MWGDHHQKSLTITSSFILSHSFITIKTFCYLFFGFCYMYRNINLSPIRSFLLLLPLSPHPPRNPHLASICCPPPKPPRISTPTSSFASCRCQLILYYSTGNNISFPSMHFCLFVVPQPPTTPPSRDPNKLNSPSLSLKITQVTINNS